ncbi:MAG TPA: hypothetical protein VG269_16680 [Tepidisphaeraceae bacterium]|jgi:hypothetical protein|nr:hypothetical protein [Tepidisphaeraceae bacterium]
MDDSRDDELDDEIERLERELEELGGDDLEEDLDSLPRNLNYVDRVAKRFFQPGWTERSLRERIKRLSEKQIRELADLNRRIAQDNQAQAVSKWVLGRILQEAEHNLPKDNTGDRFYSLIMLFLLLGEKGLEPFKSTPVDGFTISKRRPYTGPPALCQATLDAPAECVLDSDDPLIPIRLSHAAADRLTHRALSPIEWYRLMAIHGRHTYWLYDDFYGEEGQTYQASKYVERGPEVAVPTLKAVQHDLDRLIEFCLVYYEFSSEFKENSSGRSRIHEALRRFSVDDLAATLDRWIGDPPNSIAKEFRRRIFFDLDLVSPDEIRQQWNEIRHDDPEVATKVADLSKYSLTHFGAAETIDLIMGVADRVGREECCRIASSLRWTLQDRMGADMLLEVVLELMSRGDPQDRPSPVLHTLAHFKSERTLEWMEQHAVEPIGYEWGTAAALSELTWDRVERWLNKGAPLSLIALDAMKNCRGFDPKDQQMSGFFRDESPKIRREVSLREIREKLVDHARRNPSPRVSDAIAVILANIDKIFVE